MNNRRWSEKDIAYIRDNINNTGDHELAEKLNRSVCSLKQKRRKFRILRRAESCVYYLDIKDRPLCLCGCGKKTSGRYDTDRRLYPQYLKGHNSKTEKFKSEVASKISQKLIGRYVKPRFCKRCNIQFSKITKGNRRLYCRNCKTAIMSEKTRITSKKNWENNSKMRDSIVKRMNEDNPNKDGKLWKNQDYINKYKKSMNLKPNKPEMRLIYIINTNNLPFKYVGDFSLRIDKFFPDFVSTDGSNKLIEFNGDYWHNKEEHKERDKRKMISYLSNNFKVLIITDKDLINEEELKHKLITFSSLQ